MRTLILTRPDDWHMHLRDQAVLAETVAAAARSFGRVIVMPNLPEPVIDANRASAYKARILQHRPAGSSLQPLMTLYLTDNTTPAMVREAHQRGDVVALKLYPAGATTHSAAGVTCLERIFETLATMAACQLPLLVHGEVTDPDIDIFDREKIFIDRHMTVLIRRFPHLKVVLEHITTAEAVQFVTDSPAHVAATITAHHLLYNRNQLLAGGLRPHYYCLPVLKRQHHQQALLAAATSGNKKFFLGTDSAPHAISAKETSCGCAGCYTAPVAMAMYAEAFEHMNALDKLEGFASHFGPDFYGLPRNQATVTLIKKPWQVPMAIPFGAGEQVVPMKAGETLQWRLQ